jgi:hypothetical protein
MGSLSPNENLDVECRVCRGYGFDTKGYFSMLTVCHKCNGHGYVDWVTAAVKGSIAKPDIKKEIQINVAHQNIIRLRNKIIDIGMEMGVHITVNIKAIETDDITMMRPEFPKNFIKIGDY